MNGFGPEPESHKLKCLAPDGVVGTKSAPAFYMLGDSHSVALRDTIRAATMMPVFTAGWWGAHHPGTVFDIMPELTKVVQAWDVVGYGAMWLGRTVEQITGEITALAQLVVSKGAYLVIFEDNPMLQPNCFTSAAGPLPTLCQRTWADVSAAHQPYADAVAALVASNTNVFYFNGAPNLLCDSATANCDVNVPGTSAIAYRDENHLNSNGARYLAPFLCQFLQDNGLDEGGLH
jgi:hypothetical protein